MKTANPPRKVYIIAAVITVAIMASIPLRAWNEKQWQKKMNTIGGKVGIVNMSDHRVAMQLYGHDSAGVVIRDYEMEPDSELVLRDSISETEVLAFPPEGFVDSAILVFDDTVKVKHCPREFAHIYPYNPDYRDHCIQERSHWQYETVTVRRWVPRGGVYIYRPVRRYIFTNEDYDRARAATPSRSASVRLLQ